MPWINLNNFRTARKFDFLVLATNRKYLLIDTAKNLKRKVPTS